MAAARWSKAQLMLGRCRLKTPQNQKRSLLARTQLGSSQYSSAYERMTALLLFASISLAVAESIDATRPRLCAKAFQHFRSHQPHLCP